jgi:ketosteroid isomerase-like protein
LPAFAQQKDAADSQIRQQLDTLDQEIDEAFNNGDPAALAASFTEDAVLVNDTGPVYGREAIEKYYADLFQKVHLSNWLTMIDQNSPHVLGTAGNEMWETGDWSGTIFRVLPVRQTRRWSTQISLFATYG